MSKPNLVLLSGWGMDSRVWEHFACMAQRDFEVTTLALPGFEIDCSLQAAELEVTQVIDYLVDRLPARSMLCGWSLGGMLATLIARHHPERTTGLITLCSNPKFVATNDWQYAMPAQQFAAFVKGFECQPMRTLQRFRSLVAQGALSSKQDLRALNRLSSTDQVAKNNYLASTLALLGSLDVRADLARVNNPKLHILGAKDALVPQQLAAQLQSLDPASSVKVIENCGHLPSLSHPDVLLELVKQHCPTAEIARRAANAG